jgi:hypothetical protein
MVMGWRRVHSSVSGDASSPAALMGRRTDEWPPFIGGLSTTVACGC